MSGVTPGGPSDMMHLYEQISESVGDFENKTSAEIAKDPAVEKISKVFTSSAKEVQHIKEKISLAEKYFELHHMHPELTKMKQLETILAHFVIQQLAKKLSESTNLVADVKNSTPLYLMSALPMLDNQTIAKILLAIRADPGRDVAVENAVEAYFFNSLAILDTFSEDSIDAVAALRSFVLRKFQNPETVEVVVKSGTAVVANKFTREQFIDVMAQGPNEVRKACLVAVLSQAFKKPDELRAILKKMDGEELEMCLKELSGVAVDVIDAIVGDLEHIKFIEQICSEWKLKPEGFDKLKQLDFLRNFSELSSSSMAKLLLLASLFSKQLASSELTRMLKQFENKMGAEELPFAMKKSGADRYELLDEQSGTWIDVSLDALLLKYLQAHGEKIPDELLCASIINSHAPDPAELEGALTELEAELGKGNIEKSLEYLLPPTKEQVQKWLQAFPPAS